MNEWIQRSIELANDKEGYLDKLHDVYPVSVNKNRPMSINNKKELEIIFKKQDAKGLILFLLKENKFPIKDPYVAFFRRSKNAINKNPKTVSRIASRLFSLGVREVIKGIEEPKEFNREIGALFKKFLPKAGCPLLKVNEFDKYAGTAILNGSDAELKNYASLKLGYKLDKGLDLLIRIHKKYIIGEAKFLTDIGGHQNNQFEDALRLIKDKSTKAIKIGILDGVVWIAGKNKMHKKITSLKDDQIALSALLLKDFIESFK